MTTACDAGTKSVDGMGKMKVRKEESKVMNRIEEEKLSKPESLSRIYSRSLSSLGFLPTVLSKKNRYIENTEKCKSFTFNIFILT